MAGKAHGKWKARKVRALSSPAARMNGDRREHKEAILRVIAGGSEPAGSRNRSSGSTGCVYHMNKIHKGQNKP